MNEEKLLKIGTDLIYLAACALRSVTPDMARARDMQLNSVSKMASFHSMQAIAYLSLANLAEKEGFDSLDGEAISVMRRDYGLALRRTFNLEAERAALIKFLEEKKIWYLTLKGIILQHYYPKMGMRQMTDNDILINPIHAKCVRDFFLSRGYEIYSFGKGCHDIYIKGDVTFEIHRTLASEEKKNRKNKAFCNAAVKRSLSRAGDSLALSLSEEDFYVYFIFHTYKHFSTSGCGIRSLMDIYLYNKAKRDELDIDAVNANFEALNLFEFEKMTREISMKIFPDDPSEVYSIVDGLSDEEKQRLLYFITSGTFGTQDQLIKNSLAAISTDEKITFFVKLKYTLRRIFPPFDYYKMAHPRLYKFIVTIPFLWLYRIFRGLRKSDKVAKEIKKLKNTK
ncbi:MAG: nucleotidyltransferase family protein [Clostridia bacterium]|nr:nucleotidyltransferase family protein [Clostridia bacterium]